VLELYHKVDALHLYLRYNAQMYQGQDYTVWIFKLLAYWFDVNLSTDVAPTICLRPRQFPLLATGWI